MIPSQVYKHPSTSDLHLASPREGAPGPGPYYKCHVCGIYYDTEQKLHFHMELHSERYGGGSQGAPPGPPPPPNDIHGDMGGSMNSPFDYLICPECNLSFKTDDDYRRHLLVHVFKCRLCGLTLENEMAFLVHVKGHGESNTQQPYHCFLCDKQFSHVSHLTRHVLTHPDEQPFECVECGKRFARKGHLTRHMTMHSKCRPYTCQDCGKTFAHRTHLRRHEIVHSGLRPHKCRVCQQSFSRKSSLSRHYFIHTTEKPFVCPVCEKGFNRKGRLKNHLKIHIREGYPDLVDYVIERRPITKEFIEKINMVKPEGEDSSEFASSAQTPSDAPDGSGFSGSFRTSDKVNVDGDDDDDPLPGIKEESDDEGSSSSESEGENDEEADMSEEISYFEPAPTGDMSSNSMVTMVSASASSKKSSSLEDRTSSPARGAPGGDESSASSYRNAETPPYHNSQSGVDYLTATSETSYSTADTVHVDSMNQNELPLES
jgi:rubrerythrin